ncbi:MULTISPECIES: YhcN/YlaJ family sporulation lipoprotein [Bacillaceae]|uniref:YhcN/YlaJ family sporulation lipoprotein n=1 Tax=Bacillaceae TaxID=186817 RepID=UPI000A5A71E9|nr:MULTISPECIES: YhcN/YlaJ family sporulation lipoprotein [Bacillaceae]MBO1000287.1 YhcN/YlaJ family sporulation lipoprotein [Bacillus sp. SD075]MCM3169491.1 YhcN/YlaJ family sporulation lipoprotein [Peribacillus frigoritolerans]MEE3956027.1 YhcN/YlaJ family sporulation lipoprotein [Peribacillus frigoritolerans]
MKDKINQFIMFLLLLTVIGLGSGCNQKQSGEDHEDLSISQVHTSKPIDQSVANQAKKKVIKEEDISNVKAVNTDKELLIAIKVENFERFRLKKIEKNVKSDLEKDYPDHKILVSTDSKMYLELDQLEQKIQKDNTNRKELEKDFNKIKSLMKEET